jgi:hypothetical protein
MIRKWFTTVSLLVLLLSAWGSVFAAFACPHTKAGRACCHARAGGPSSSHEEMAGMLMDDAQHRDATDCAATEHATAEHRTVAETVRNADAEAAEKPNEACAHCTSHSQLPVTSASLREASRAERDEGQTQTPPPSNSSDINTASITSAPSAKGHAPPGACAAARHVLINVFRI